MALIEVYNTTTGPVVYGDGQVIGGLERMKVEESLVADALQRGLLRVARSKPVAATKVVVAEPVVDSQATQSDVPLNPVESKPSGDTDETSSVDEGSTAKKPATISKTRRPRKSPVKE